MKHTPHLRKASVKSLLAGAVLLSVAAAQAGSISQIETIPLQPTDWNASLQFDQFNPSLGTLESIEWSLTGFVNGDIAVESLDPTPSTITSALKARVTLTRPDNSTLVVIIPLIQRIDDVDSYDGNLDFLGASGRTHLNLTGYDTKSATSTDVLDLALFTGPGTIDLPVFALAESYAAGPGNLAAIFVTTADATVTVTYNYRSSQVVDGGGACVLLGLAMAGMMMANRRSMSLNA